MNGPRLRVAILGLNYSPEPTGIAPYTTALAEDLARRGHHVRVLAAHPHYPAWRIMDGFGGWRSTSVEHGVEVTRLLHFVPRSPTHLQRMISELSFGVRLALASWRRPDVVVAVSPALFADWVVRLRLRLSFRRPGTILWVQDLYAQGMAETGERGAGLRFVRAVESSTLRAADAVIAIHPRFSEPLARLGVRPERIRVIRNWTHVEVPDHVDRAAVRARRGWGDDETVVVHAGNIGAKQALEYVVAAAEEALARGERVRFVIVGDGNQARSLRALADGVERIEMLDPLPQGEFAELLAAADVLLVNERPGLVEMSAPSKLTTYFEAGTPIVAATEATSITAEEIERSGAGIRVDPGEPKGILEAVLTLRHDTELAARLGSAGRRYGRRSLDQQSSLEALSALIQKVGAQGR